MNRTSIRRRFVHAVVVLSTFSVARVAEAACVNKFVYRQDKARINMTLLTGKLTFQEAKELADAINTNKAPDLEWLDDKGKIITRSSGQVMAVRPMPVGCDDKKSGSVITATFLRNLPPSGKMIVRLTPELIVTFEQQL